MGAIEKIKSHEGLKLRPYRCPAGKLTIGYGRNLDDKGITQEEADYLFEHDILEAQQDLRLLFDPVSASMTLGRWEALLDMRFNMGPAGFRKFEKMIEAIQVADWDTAVEECLDSEYAKQVPKRAMENTEALKLG